MNCARLLTTQAYIDNELEAAAALAAKKHTETCGECAALCEQALVLRRALREETTYYRAPEAFRRSLRESTGNAESALSTHVVGPPRPTRQRSRFLFGTVWGAIAAFAASLMIFVLSNSAPDEMARDIVSAHIRSLTGSHLVDVASGDDHTVKPWFYTHLDMSPPVRDFENAGFRLVGGRVDYVDGRHAAVTVYRLGDHVVNVFAWRDVEPMKSGTRERDGYNLLSWRQHGLFFCAISDANGDELVRLSELIEQSDHVEE